MPGPEGVEHIAQVDSRHFLGAGQWLGRTVDYQHSANGKVFAGVSAALRPLAHARRARTGDDHRPELARRARRARDGFATSIDELEIGLAAIAAPVRGASGEVIAALSITGPTLRMTPERIEELHPILIQRGADRSAAVSATSR